MPRHTYVIGDAANNDEAMAIAMDASSGVGIVFAIRR
jgi:hypothetical protein